MKKTVKQWCKEYDFDWYGPGVMGEHQYDYKIIYRSSSGTSTVGRFFATQGHTKKPIYGRKKRGEFLLFPVYSQVIGDKEMSQSKFESVSNWVQNCLSGSLSEYSKENDRPQQKSQPTDSNKSDRQLDQVTQ